MTYLTSFNPTEFLAKYWQKEAVVLRQVLPDFQDFLDEHELAGLAMEDDIDSRIISKHNNNWEVHSGPFSEFTQACIGQWTLLVQGVDRVIPEASELMERFSFIPHWRMDDLMVSFAVPGAGVGPHTDQYDVFLVQGKGERRWTVGKPDAYKDIFPHPKLRQINGFSPVIDVVLAPGDVLYVPPGWAHDGVALTDSLTYSVGFRAPDQQQLSGVLADTLFDPESKNARFTDTNRTVSPTPYLVNKSDIHALRELMIDALHSDQWEDHLMRHLSEQTSDCNNSDGQNIHDVLVTGADIKDHLALGGYLERAPGLRPLLLEDKPLALYVNGECIVHDIDEPATLAALLTTTVIDADWLSDKPSNLELLTLLATLVNKNHWELCHY